jgi:hypothetical protein
MNQDSTSRFVILWRSATAHAGLPSGGSGENLPLKAGAAWLTGWKPTNTGHGALSGEGVMCGEEVRGRWRLRIRLTPRECPTRCHQGSPNDRKSGRVHLSPPRTSPGY